MVIRLVNPETLVRPVGYSHAAVPVQRGTRPVLLAGQIGSGLDGKVEHPDNLVRQVAKALDNLVEALRAAGGEPTDVARLRIYTTDVQAYREKLGEIGAEYRARFGKHFPAMALLGVKELFDDGAQVEIEGTAYVE